MTALIIGVAAFLLGAGIGAGCIIHRVRSGRLVAGGRVYLCRDSGPAR